MTEQSPYAYRDCYSPYAYGDRCFVDSRMRTGSIAIPVCVWGLQQSPYAYRDCSNTNPHMHTGIATIPVRVQGLLAARGLEKLFFKLCCRVSFWFWQEIGFGFHTYVLRVPYSCGVVSVFLLLAGNSFW